MAQRKKRRVVATPGIKRQPLTPTGMQVPPGYTLVGSRHYSNRFMRTMFDLIEPSITDPNENTLDVIADHLDEMQDKHERQIRGRGYGASFLSATQESGPPVDIVIYTERGKITEFALVAELTPRQKQIINGMTQRPPPARSARPAPRARSTRKKR